MASRASVSESRPANDTARQPSAGLLGRGQVAQIRPVPLTGVDDHHASLAHGVQHPARGRDGPPQRRDVVAQHFAEPPGLDEIALHVNDQQRRA
jgi:hypothetical protein